MSKPYSENDNPPPFRTADSELKEVQKRGELYYGGKILNYSLPFYRPFSIPPPKTDEVAFLPTLIQESCGYKIITGGLMGSVLGVGMGLFMGAMGDVTPIQISQGREVPQAPVREQLRSAMRSTGQKSAGWAKSFGVLTALFGGVDCLIEKYRGKHDVWNPVLSGCAVGAAISAKGGPAAACIGCAGFAGFSLVVDKIFGATGH
jgi:import inner membrane translocase subunit TIM22